MELRSGAILVLSTCLLSSTAEANFFGDPGEYMVQGNPEAAARSLEQRARDGDADAMFALAHLYRIGAGVPQNIERSTSLYLEAATLGHVDAQYMIGICYERGRGTDKDLEQARRWLAEASRSGHRDAAVRLALLAPQSEAQPAADGSSPSTGLTDRIAAGDADAVRALLEAGADPNSRDPLGTPVLHTAVLRGEREIVSELISHGVDLEATNLARDTALHVAAANGDTALADLLIGAGADPDAVDLAGWSPRQLLARGEPDAAAPQTETPLTQRLGAYANDPRYTGWSAIAVASSVGDAGAVSALVARGASLGPDATGYTPLLRAVQSRRAEIAGQLLDAGADPRSDSAGALALTAVANGDLETLELLLAHGAPPDRTDENGATALSQAVHDGRADLVTTLLAHGAPVDQPTASGLTPLMLATDAGRSDLTSALLNAGADPSPTDAEGRTALHHAASSCNPDVIDVLTRRARPVADATGRWPLHLAAASGCAALARALLAQGHPVDPVSSADNTPLAIAATTGSSEIVRMLLAADANPNRRDRRGETPLHRAVRKGHVEAVAILLSGGAKPSIRNDNGLNAFDLSAGAEIDAVLDSDEPLRLVAARRK